MYSISQIAGFMKASVLGDGDISMNWQLLIDSRTLTNPGTSIFFALTSRFNDGHRYIPELIEKGVTVFVVREDHEIPQNTNCHFLIVEDVKKALQDLAGEHRKEFKLPVIGITGSNGKTVVKEWLVQLLGHDRNICFSPKSYNSQIGVPLSVWQLQEAHELAIFEAGISTINEMEVLEQIIRPGIGILTHLGTAHNEGFENFEQKVQEKLKLFRHCQVVLMAYDPEVSAQIQAPLMSFGFEQPEADLNITRKKISEESTEMTALYLGKKLTLRIPFTDEASIENCCICWLCTLYLDCFEKGAFLALSPVSMRLELKKGIHGCLLVNDSYSNDLNALSTALSFLKQQTIHQKTTVILSDIEESGLEPGELFLQVCNLLLEKQVRRLIAIGPVFYEQQDLFTEKFETFFFRNTVEFLDHFYELRFHEENILIKGARKFQFEIIAKRLEQLSHGTVLEINLTAAMHNLNTIKERLEPGIKIMAMVKAFAYGSGSYEMAKLVQNKVDYLAVAYSDEGVALRQNGINIPIMVMNTDEDSFDQLVRYDLEPVIFSLAQLKTITGKIEMQTLKVHVEIDTGMHRLGFKPEDIQGLTAVLKNNPKLIVASIFSHLSASDEARYDDFTNYQFDTFRSVASEIGKSIGYHALKHISNTAATLRFKQEGLDMVRLGIGLYGIDPTGKFDGLLEPVFTFKTTVSQVKQIGPNESVGYSRMSISRKSRTIAILALGYADGLNRALSNGNGSFRINGKKAPIIGNICMDMCMVDVSGLQCNEGDEAILFGKNVGIQKVAEQLGTIPYEILTSISQRVKRVYVSE
jgi:alanine racemase